MKNGKTLWILAAFVAGFMAAAIISVATIEEHKGAVKENIQQATEGNAAVSEHQTEQSGREEIVSFDPVNVVYNMKLFHRGSCKTEKCHLCTCADMECDMCRAMVTGDLKTLLAQLNESGE